MWKARQSDLPFPVGLFHVLPFRISEFFGSLSWTMSTPDDAQLELPEPSLFRTQQCGKAAQSKQAAVKRAAAGAMPQAGHKTLALPANQDAISSRISLRRKKGSVHGGL